MLYRDFGRPDFPSILEYELPAFMSDQDSLRENTTLPYFTPPLTASNAVYAIWIGANDLGVFFEGGQYPGKILNDYLNCVYRVLDGLYHGGGRVFVLMNVPPLHLTPLYSNVDELMQEYVTTVNAIYKYRTPYEALIARRYPNASFATFNVSGLIENMYRHPERYFNGTMPANVTSPEQTCVPNASGVGSTCVKMYNGTSSDSFLWFDELHPSTQTDRNVARTFLDVLNGKSTYAEYW
jgi:phospholipase/lecithinase/hemolysin